MSRRGEHIPYSFVAEADRFRSNVAPPPRRRVSPSEVVGRTLIGLTIVAGLVGSLLFGLPALETAPDAAHGPRSEAAHRP